MLLKSRTTLPLHLACRSSYQRIASPPHLPARHPLDRLRFRKQQKFDRPFEILAFPIAKSFAAIVRFGQPEALQSGAHRTVEHDDALPQKGGKRMGCVWHGRKETSFRARFKEQIDAS